MSGHTRDILTELHPRQPIFWIAGSTLKTEREQAELGQEAVARVMDVSVKTIQRLEKADQVKNRDANAYRRALSILLEETKSPDSRPRRVDEINLVPYIVTSSVAVVRRPRVLAWLYRFRADLIELGATEDQAENASDLVQQIVRSPAVGGAHQEWTEDDAIAAMEPEAEDIKKTFTKLKRR